ncbi:hypothetical protein D9M72_561200 [compost metagenome]
MPAIDRAPAGNDAITRNLLLFHAEIDAAMGDIHVKLLERSLVEQHFQSFAGREFALAVLGINTFLPAADARLSATRFKLFEKFLHSLCLWKAMKLRIVVPMIRASMPHSESLKRCGCVIYKFANSEMRICKYGTEKTLRWQKNP